MPSSPRLRTAAPILHPDRPSTRATGSLRETAREAAGYYHELLWSTHLDDTVTGLNVPPDGQRPTLLRPHFMTSAECVEHAASARAIARGMLLAGQRLLADQRLRRQLGVPAYLDELVGLEPPDAGPSVFARFDGLVEQGVLRTIEYNSAPGAIHFISRLTRAFELLGITRAFRRRFPGQPILPSLLALDAIRRDCQRRAVAIPPRVVLVRTDGATIGASYAPGGFYGAKPDERLESASVSELDYRGGVLRFEDRPVDMVVLHAWADLLTRSDASGPLRSAIRNGHVRVVNGLSKAFFASYKHAFELLSNPIYAALFPADVRAVLARHVPWTRVVRDCRTTLRDRTIDLLPFVAEHKDGFVLKPAGALGGAGLLMGWVCDDDTWRRRLKAAIDTFVVQERVVGDKEPYPVASGGSAHLVTMTFDCCPYVLDGDHIGGYAVRVSPTEVTNVAAGGMNAAVWVLEA
jgi:hypothetical protein